MAKSKKSSKKQSPSSKAEKVVKDEAVKTEKVEKAEKTEKAEKKVEKKKKGFFGKLFERKFDANECGANRRDFRDDGALHGAVDAWRLSAALYSLRSSCNHGRGLCVLGR